MSSCGRVISAWRTGLSPLSPANRRSSAPAGGARFGPRDPGSPLVGLLGEAIVAAHRCGVALDAAQLGLAAVGATAMQVGALGSRIWSEALCDGERYSPYPSERTYRASLRQVALYEATACSESLSLRLNSYTNEGSLKKISGENVS
jgi:hypothetical protein